MDACLKVRAVLLLTSSPLATALDMELSTQCIVFQVCTDVTSSSMICSDVEAGTRAFHGYLKEIIAFVSVY